VAPETIIAVNLIVVAYALPALPVLLNRALKGK
jgi:hypothetical protein